MTSELQRDIERIEPLIPFDPETREAWQRLRARIAELEAVLAKFDERWLLDGELGFCVACGAEAGEDHKPECWLTEANAARGAK